MEGYLLNVFMSASPFLVAGAAIFLVTFLIPCRNPQQSVASGQPAAASTCSTVKLAMRKYSLVFAAAGVLYAAVLPSNTPKNTLGVDIKKQNQAITEQIKNADKGVIRDITPKPKMTDEQRQEHFERQVDRSALIQ